MTGYDSQRAGSPCGLRVAAVQNGCFKTPFSSHSPTHSPPRNLNEEVSDQANGASRWEMTGDEAIPPPPPQLFFFYIFSATEKDTGARVGNFLKTFMGNIF